MSCETIDFLYPFFADVYYPTISQTPSGAIKKSWALDRTIICNAANVGGAGKDEIVPDAFVQNEGKLIARAKLDLRTKSNGTQESPSNILITNIRNCSGDIIYKETAGPRKDDGSIYEISMIEPFVGPFGSIEYYKMLWRKTEAQNVLSEGVSQ